MKDGSNVTQPLMTSTDRLDDIQASEHQRLLPTAVFLGLIACTGLLGNILVLYVFGTKIKRSNSQIFIVFVAAVNMFSCCIAIPYEITLLMKQLSIQHMWMCKASRFFNTLGTCTTSTILVFIAVDRFRKVCRPFQSQINSRMARVFCILSVVFGVLVALPTLFLYGNKTFGLKQDIVEEAVLRSKCVIAEKMETSSLKVVNTAMLSGLFIIGFVTMSVLYCLIGCKIRKQSKMMGLMSAKSMSNPIKSVPCDKNTANIHEHKTHEDVAVRKRNDIIKEDIIIRPKAEKSADSLDRNGEVSYASSEQKNPFNVIVSYKNKTDKHLDVQESGDNTNSQAASNERKYLFSKFERLDTIESTGISQDRVSSVESHTRIASCGSRIDNTGEPQVPCRKDTRARKMAVIMSLISFVFILSYLPRLILMATRAIKGEFVEGLSSDGRAVYMFFSRWYFLNCVINPVIYGLCDTRFRTSCAELFRRCCSRKKRSVQLWNEKQCSTTCS